MVRKKQFTTRTGKDGSACYFAEHLSASDYYQSRGGILRGKTFEHLGMSKREVNLKVFSALESNLHPETGERITLRTNNTRRERWINSETGQEEIRIVDNHRPGMDLAFVVPKTLSVVMAENAGEFADSIEKVCIAAKDKAMELAESLALVRVRKGSAQEDRLTGNLLYLSVVPRSLQKKG